MIQQRITMAEQAAIDMAAYRAAYGRPQAPNTGGRAPSKMSLAITRYAAQPGGVVVDAALAARLGLKLQSLHNEVRRAVCKRWITPHDTFDAKQRRTRRIFALAEGQEALEQFG